MKRICQIILTGIIFIPSVLAYAQKTGTTKYKCMIQMANYIGEGAYMVVSVIDSKDEYNKTLCVLGEDKKWYPSLKKWHQAFKARPTKINAITGASVAGGDRAVVVLEIENEKIDAGYKLRFESVVEDNKYYLKDVEIPLTKETLEAKTEGAGYIRYIRFTPAI